MANSCTIFFLHFIVDIRANFYIEFYKKNINWE